MQFETKFNIGDKVYIGDDKTRIYEIDGVTLRTFKGVGVIVEYKLLRPQDGLWAGEHRLSIAPEIVTNKDCVHTLVHTLRDIYGVDELPIPEGYKFKDFAHPKVGEYIVSNVRLTTDPKFVVGICQINITSPRIILERK